MVNSEITFEILISTMFRSDLSFIDTMFSNVDFKKYTILIINQTDKERQLISPYEHVRVINTEERGLSKSRNMAIRNAIGDVCLVADDDVIYKKDFRNSILQSYIRYPDAAVITFQLENTKGALYRNYPDVVLHTNLSITSVNGVVISFKRDVLLTHDVWYHPHFGLGATFGTADEYVFMKTVLKTNLLAYFVPETILTHPDHSSGRDQGSDRVLYARGALSYKYYGALSYLWVIKYLFFIVRKGYIVPKSAFTKAKKAYAGILAYKSLLKSGEEHR